MTSSPITLPRPERLLLHRFSLFERVSTVDIRFPNGVLCLAGANGLGKSTFLAALNYAITGVVPQPDREFLGVEDYYEKVQPYTKSFFRGRIVPEDSEAAQVELTMQAGLSRYRLVRGMFDPTELREFEVISIEDGSPIVEDDAKLDGREKQQMYESRLVEDCGLESMAQVAFLQHFVLTFDERRELLFWGQRTLPAALFIAFGLDAAKAKQADHLQEEVRKADSLARNYSWHATDWRNKLETLEEVADETVADVDDAARKHEELQSAQDEVFAEQQRLAGELSALQVDIASHSAQLQADRQEYDELWTRRLQGHGHPAMHPVITTSLGGGRCALCGTTGAEVGAKIKDRLAAEHCPLCDSPLDPANVESPVEIDDLAELDEKISRHVARISAAEKSVKELEGQLLDARARFESQAAGIAKFEQENELALARRGGDIGLIAERYQAAIADQLQRKEKQLQRRDKAKTELRQLQRELVESYAVAEEKFVPEFTELAEQFLGVPLDVEFYARRNQVGLVLSVQEQRRPSEESLSESQRFFLDIALRMALVGQMSSSGRKGTLFVDTPEGSLDIAYEARAGDMFGSFVRNGFGLVMTANINTSKLLERLAKACGKDLMVLERMTDWSTLSEVQAQEEELFDEAYDAIEAALKSSE